MHYWVKVWYGALCLNVVEENFLNKIELSAMNYNMHPHFSKQIKPVLNINLRKHASFRVAFIGNKNA